MEHMLSDKVAVITGGAQGIGFNIADQFLKEGATVLILDINEELGENAEKELKSKYGDQKINFMKCDVTNDLETVFKQIIKKNTYVDVLVNNAGIVREDSIRKTLEVNTIAPIEWTIKFRDFMRTDKGGKGGTIINISSIYGYRVDPFMVYYKASKFAVFGFSKALGHKLNYEKSRVRILTICPGFTGSALTVQPVLWEEHVDDMTICKTDIKWQSPEWVAKGVIDAFKIGESGSAWLIDEGQQATEL